MDSSTEDPRRATNIDTMEPDTMACAADNSPTQSWGNPAKFLSRTKQLDFRTITTLLQLTDSIEPTGYNRGPILNDNKRFWRPRDIRTEPEDPEDRAIKPTFHCSREQFRAKVRNFQKEAPVADPEDEKTCEDFMNHLNTLLVRGRESVTLIKTGATRFVAMVNDPNDPNTANQKETVGQYVPGLVLTDRPNEHSRSYFTVRTFAEDLRRLSLNDPQRATYQRGPLSSRAHADTIANMLNVVYENRGTWKFKKDFRYYVMLASNQRMLQRFRRGQGAEDFEGDVAKYLKFDLPRNNYPGIHAVRMIGLGHRRPTQNEADLIHMILERGCKTGSMDTKDAVKLGYDHGTRSFKISDPIYDAAGRDRFQTVMGLTYTAVVDALNKLEREITKYLLPGPGLLLTLDEALKSRSEEIVKNGCLQIVDVGGLENVVESAWEWLRLWYRFLEEFGRPGGLLDKHLLWLEQSFSQVPNPSHRKDPIIGHQIEDEDEIAEWIEYAVPGNLSGWARKAKAYMMSTVKHIDAVFRLEPNFLPRLCIPVKPVRNNDNDDISNALRDREDARVSLDDFARNLDLTTLEAIPEPNARGYGVRDREMTSIKSLLDKAGFTDHARELFTEWLCENHDPEGKHGIALPIKTTDDLLNTTTFTGTWNCDMIPMSLYLLSHFKYSHLETQDPIVRNRMIQSGDRSLLLPSANLLLKHCVLNSFVVGSSRRSLVSSILFQEVENKFGTRRTGYLKRSPSHNVWTATALPPWLPKEFGELLGSRASEALGQRIKQIVQTQELKRKNRRSGEPAIQIVVPTKNNQYLEDDVRTKMYSDEDVYSMDDVHMHQVKLAAIRAVDLTKDDVDSGGEQSTAVPPVEPMENNQSPSEDELNLMEYMDLTDDDTDSNKEQLADLPAIDLMEHEDDPNDAYLTSMMGLNLAV